MSNAHRPTYNAAIARGSIGRSNVRRSFTQSSKDLASHTSLKFRAPGQGGVTELKERNSLKAKLDKREDEELTKDTLLQLAAPSSSSAAKKAVDVPRLLTNKPNVSEEILKKYDDKDADEGDDGQDSDDDLESSDDDDDDDDDDDEDDEEELQRELERIKAERAAARAAAEQAEREAEEQQRRDSAIRGNPLLLSTSDESQVIKRKWNDDVVFRNQSRGEPEVKKRFINDTIRNDFHRNFLKKYIK